MGGKDSVMAASLYVEYAEPLFGRRFSCPIGRYLFSHLRNVLTRPGRSYDNSFCAGNASTHFQKAGRQVHSDVDGCDQSCTRHKSRSRI